jgi:hypothetical protein
VADLGGLVFELEPSFGWFVVVDWRLVAMSPMGTLTLRLSEADRELIERVRPGRIPLTRFVRQVVVEYALREDKRQRTVLEEVRLRKLYKLDPEPLSVEDQRAERARLQAALRGHVPLD